MSLSFVWTYSDAESRGTRLSVFTFFISNIWWYFVSTGEEPSGRPAGGRWLRKQFQKLFRGNRAQAGPNTISVTDGHLSPGDKEPQNVILTFEELLEANHLSEASQLLIEREERLFGEITEAEALEHQEEEVDKFDADRKALKDLVVQTLKQSLSTEVNVEALTSAVKAVCQEEEQDKQWKQRDGTPPAWRPSGWKKLHDSTLCSLVEEHMDNTSSSRPADLVEKSSLQVDICSMGRQLKQDLLWVVEVVKSCYPPELNICNSYAKWYHQTFSARLKKIAEFGLDDKDCTSFLLWVNDYYPEILRKPELASEIDHEALGKLLPEKLLEPLEEQYLSKQQSELTTCIDRVLEEAKQKWDDGEEPSRKDGCFVSPVAYDLIPPINGIVTTTVKVVGDQSKAQDLTYQLKDLLQRFRIFQDDIMKRSKPNSKPFIKAILSCIEHFRDFLIKKSDLFPADVQESCLSVLMDMKQSAHMYLLSPVHEVLKPLYRKLGTSDWLNNSTFENLLVSIEQEIQDLHGAAESCHQDLMGQLHQEVTAEYVKRLLRGEVKLKDKERQEKAYMTVKDNAESLHNLFVKMGSKEDWLKEILSKIAEVLKLQDLPAIQLQVVSLGTDYPDLSEKHVSALLKLKTNLTKADRRTVKVILSDALKETNVVNARPFFSRVLVK
ncbi:tumor necrosis factor alpha-induced protein 2-like [Thunnus albacares]|uniref:tumor necrosis factor alpha-induced protein 2-like n=1 Tax=Thunnus albacares TaxID=8236 RepID=UPI001CF62D15|nr:tumor necrosis factor alpha-induced protein 2-like [Thunnus albacares]